MTKKRRPYARARAVFGVLFILSALFLCFVIFTTVPVSVGIGAGGLGLDTIALALVSLLASVTTLVGFVSTTILAWRREKRETSAADLERKRQELELEKMKLDLEQTKSARDDSARINSEG